ncbi:MAG TPA: 50S ribosomal protein L10 [Candidatus Omnitrophota bacterium]|nr:50S ribosomal protein L10 [Candidatus Omnitrophota bacterium]HRZ15197.1 50S ribosomal protein L10 [Candidatus Omnitrophota bacterium]
MKKISVLVKETSTTRIHQGIAGNNSFFIIKYSGLSSPAMSTLRIALRGANAELFVVKNTVARKALKDKVGEDVLKLIDGPAGIIFYKDDPVGASKALFTFLKDNEKLKIEGGFLQERMVTTKELEALSKLPTKDVLRAQVVFTLKSPITRLVMTLKGNMRALVCCLEQIKTKKAN